MGPEYIGLYLELKLLVSKLTLLCGLQFHLYNENESDVGLVGELGGPHNNNA